MNLTPYFKFEGTATRSEYWGVTFISIAVLAAVALLAVLCAGVIGSAAAGLITIAVLLAGIWATVATTVRRCRDAGINPWFTALVFIPYVAVPACIVFGVLPTATTKGE